jgi:hypothetical protein
MKRNIVPSNKLALLSAAFCAVMLAFSHNASATRIVAGINTPTTNLTIGDAHELGTSNPGTAGDAVRTLLVNHLIGMTLNSTDTFLGEALHRSGNAFASLPTAVIGPQGGSGDTTIDLGTGLYSYLWAKYDGPNYGAEVWYVGNLSGIITIPAAAGRYGLSGWTLFGPGGGQVPDGGTTVMLLGAALGALGVARRYIMS